MRLTSTQSYRGNQTHLDVENYAGAHEQPTRKVSSTVISETLMGDQRTQQDSVRYVEVPVVQEVIVPVPHKEVVEVERRVPRVEIQYVDKTIDVPQIEYHDRIEEFPQIQEDIRYVHKTTTVDVPKEVIEHVPVYEQKLVEQFVDVPGNVVEVPRPYQVINEIPTPNYIREEYPVVVAQSLHPRMISGHERHTIETKEYVPHVVEVEIQVPKVVDFPLKARGVVEAWHRRVDVPDAQYNSIIRWLNPHLDLEDAATQQQLPFRRNGQAIPQWSGPPTWKELPPNTAVIQRVPDCASAAGQQHPAYSSNMIYHNPDQSLSLGRGSAWVGYRDIPTHANQCGSQFRSDVNYPFSGGRVAAPSFVVPASVAFPRYQSSGLVSQPHLVTHTAHPSMAPASRSITPLFETPVESKRTKSKHHRSAGKHRSR